MISVGVLGAAGRMGRTVCQAVAADPDLSLAAAVDTAAAVSELESVPELGGAAVSESPEVLRDAGVEVAVDFTVVEAARSNLRFLASEGIHAVVGTTGLDSGDLERIERDFSRSNCIIAPNFAISAVLMMRFAEMAAPFFDSAEIVELHHDGKVDAPSGTALMTGERMSAASEAWNPDPTQNEVLAGARGGKGPGGIRIHSVRLSGMTAHQEVILGTQGQSLTIRGDSYDRSCFMPGVLLAVKAVRGRPGLTLGLEPLLDL